MSEAQPHTAQPHTAQAHRGPQQNRRPSACPRLIPGVQVLRRDAETWQVGTCPGVMVADGPGVRSLLRLADGSRTVEQLCELVREECGDPESAVARLIAAGALIADPAPARPRLVIAIHADPAMSEPATLLRQLLGQRVRLAASVDRPDLHIALHLTEPRRSRFGEWTARGEPHVLLTADGDRVRVGPFVVPGRTACLHCYDRDREAWDPAWPLILSQVGRGATRLGVDRVTLIRACSAVATDVLLAADGRSPRTAGQVFVLGPSANRSTGYPVTPDPHCDCRRIHTETSSGPALPSTPRTIL